MRFGVGRPDTPHIAMASPVIFLTAFYIIQLYTKLELTVKTHQFWPVVVCVGALFLPLQTFDFTKLFAAGNVQPAQMKEFIKLPNDPDLLWLRPSQLEITKFIKDNTSEQDSIFIFVPEPLYYYTTNRDNPSRFAISWFADPTQYSNELLESLKSNQPKYILYDLASSPYRIGDGIPIADRIPNVNKWILENYPNKIQVADATILSK